jgi:starch synthase
MPLKILFAASELTPIAKVGGLGDVIGSLPKALKKMGADVRVVIPKYGAINKEFLPAAPTYFEILVDGERVDVFETLIPGSDVKVYLLDNKRFFAENGIYFSKSAFVDSSEEIERFLFFSKAVSKIFGKMDWAPEIIHCHDWHTAAIPYLLKEMKAPVKTLLTIHNLANQGKWDADMISDFLGIKLNQLKFNILGSGIENADMINTVSMNYRGEVLTEEYGEGLAGALLKRKENFYGILNGLDYDFFNPEKDKNIKANYSLGKLSGKREDKIDLQKILGLKQDENAPLFGLVSRLTGQKGVDLACEIIPDLVSSGCQIAILGVGEEEYESKLAGLADAYPENVSSNIKFDASLAQKIYAGCDMFLMPSKFEPCGLGQMIAMRYGTIPVVRKTGGLADTVKEGITGFLFDDYSKEKLWQAVLKSLSFYREKNKWKKLMKNAMAQQFSWEKSAREYIFLYKKLLNEV